MPEKGLYLYCLTQGSPKEDLKLSGIEEGKVLFVPVNDLIAVVQECAQPFCSEDKEVVTKWVLRHQQVVDATMTAFGNVIPFSFDTLIVAKDGKTAGENLQEWAQKEEPHLRKKFAKLKGRAEYGVQISWDPNTVAPRVTANDPEVKVLKEEIQATGVGTAYLLRQKLETLLKSRLEIAADAYFKEFYRVIKLETEDIRVEKIKKLEPPRQMLMNLSCLLSKERVSRLGHELDKISEIQGFFVRFTGPWPPYSFSS
jgi:hypothetical protein